MQIKDRHSEEIKNMEIAKQFFHHYELAVAIIPDSLDQFMLNV